MSSLRKNFISLLFLQGSNYIIPLITFPYLVRILTPDGYGKLGFAINIIQYFCLFIDFGFNLSASKAIAQSEQNKEVISKIYWNTMYAKLLLLLVSLLVIIFFSWMLSDHRDVSNLVIILFLQLVGTFLMPVWFFQGIEKMSNITISYILARSSSIPFVFLFVKTINDVNIAACIQGSTSFAAGLVSVFLVIKSGFVTSIITPKIHEIIKSLKDSVPFFIGGLAISLYTMSTPFILGIFSTPHDVGIYMASDRLRQALMGFFLIFGGALYPRVNALFNDSIDKGFLFVRKILLIQGGITFITSVVFFFMAPFITNLVMGELYYDAIYILRFMAPMIFVVTTSVVLCNYLLLPLGHSAIYAKIPIFTSILHLIYIVPMSYWYGAKGAGVSMLITEVISLMLLFSINRKYGYIKSVFYAK